MQAGTARLVGTDEERILRETSLLLDDAAEYRRMAHVHNPYGDGRASQRISDLILSFFRPNLD
jgi:UDP-N-acetylglucosamine 2-epimerase (non-hydrolysing)